MFSATRTKIRRNRMLACLLASATGWFLSVRASLANFVHFTFIELTWTLIDILISPMVVSPVTTFIFHLYTLKCYYY